MSARTAEAAEPETRQASPKLLRRSRLLRWAVRGVLVLFVGLLAWWVIDVPLGQNLHTVIPGRVYRAAQPTPESLRRIVRDHGIRTVVNLRGNCNPLPWYLDESQTSQHLGINQEDVSFSAIHLPSRSELRELLDILDRSEYPILLHCRQGADRTGMAAAVVLLLQDGAPYAAARRELGLRYGHLSFGKTAYLDRFFDLYEEWLQSTGKEHQPSRFRHWLLHEYRGGWCNGLIEHVEPAGTFQAGRPIAFSVRVRNRSTTPLHFKPTITAGVHVCYRLWDSQGNAVTEGRAGFLDAAVPPGESMQVTMVLAPLAAARYRIEIDLIEEFHCWFSQVGSDPWEEEFVVCE